jgi:hypothetical protein
MKDVKDLIISNLNGGNRRVKHDFSFLQVVNVDHKLPSDYFVTSTQYHHSIAFEIFYENFTYPIAIGGRYNINTPNKIFQAIGSTIYMNHLRKIDVEEV